MKLRFVFDEAKVSEREAQILNALYTLRAVQALQQAKAAGLPDADANQQAAAMAQSFMAALFPDLGCRTVAV